MFDENKHTHPQNNDEGPRHIHRGIKRSEPDEVEVDSADFFSPEPPRPKAPPKPAPTPPSEPPKPPVPPRRQWEPLHPSEPTPADDKLPKGGMVLLVLQAILSLAALVQLWRTQMLPVLYLVIITALLVLLWLLVRKCLASRSGAVVARVLSVLLCAALAVGCVWVCLALHGQRGQNVLGNAACIGGRGIVRTLCALFQNGGDGVGYQQNCDHCAQKAQPAADGAVPCPARCRMIFV